MKKASFRIPYLGLSGALLFTGAAATSAQTSGSLSTATAVNYSTAPWTITSGSGTYPDGGGVATFNEQIGTVAGTFPAVPAITIDVPVTLSGLTFNSVYQYQLVAGAGSLSLTTTGTNTLSVPTSNSSSPTLFAAGNVIAAPIGGGGTFGLTKTGAGTVTLAGTNTYTGGTTINGGVLRVSTGDVALGTTGAGNDVTLNGGALRTSTTAFTSARNFSLGTGGGTFELFVATTLNGVVSGPGSLTARVGSALTLTGANTYTGATTLQSNGSLTLSGTGSITTSSALDLTGTLNLSNATTNVNDRVGDATPITLRGATIALTGNAAAATTEATGAITLASGNSTLTVTPAAGGASILAPSSINRTNNATLLVRGTSLGNAAAASVAQITPVTGPTLVGGGGAAGSTTISIVPWMVGNTSAAAVVSSSLVTNAGTGLRPLATTEYAASLTGSTNVTNVRLTAASAVPTGGATANAVVLTATGTTALTSAAATDVLNIASGALLYSPAANTAGTITANLNFGTAEGIISSSNTAATLTLSGVIAGSGGLTLNAFGNTTLPTATASFAISGTSNTYTGQTTLNNGLTTFTGTLSNDGVTPSALGTSTTPIVLNAGAIGARLYSGATGSIINRDILVTGTAGTVPTGTAGIGTVGVYPLTVNGNIVLNRPLSLEGGGNATNPVIVNGNISGTGYLTDLFSSFNLLNGNNTFSGGLNINTGTYIAGSDTAFGTGTIYSTASAGFIQGSGTAARTLANSFLFENGATTTFTFNGTAPLTFTGGVNLNGTTSLTFSNSAATTFTGVVANGGLIKAGTGVMALNNASGNTYTGGTSVTSGPLVVNNTTGSGTGSGAVSIGATSTLAGRFTLSGATSIAGRLSPGNGPGLTAATVGVGDIALVSFAGPLTLSSSSTSSLFLEVAGNVNYDRVVVGGIFTLNGTVNVASTGGYVTVAGDTYDFIDFASITVGTFTINSSALTLAPGVTLDTSTFAVDGIIRAVPEPTTFALFGLGAVMVAGGAVRRRRRAA